MASGENYLLQWTKSAAGEGFSKERGNFSALCPRQPLLCLAPLLNPDHFVAGTSSGELYLFLHRNAIKSIRAHDGAVSALHATEHAVISGGEKDRRIRLWTHRLEPGASFDMTMGFGDSSGLRSLCLSGDGITILIGTCGANIYEVLFVAVMLKAALKVMMVMMSTRYLQWMDRIFGVDRWQAVIRQGR